MTRLATIATSRVQAFEIPHHVGTYERLAAPRALLLPFGFSVALALLALVPPASTNPRLFWSLAGTAGVLVLWSVALMTSAARRGRTLALEILFRKQHYLQACAQGSVLIYWGWYWREVYASAPLLVAQLLFAYAFDMLLMWSRRDRYTFGFGPFPIIFSINLFLWFKQDWFYLQFLMIAVGLLAKELLRWDKDGRSAHIFNPSSFPLGVFSLVLILTGTTRLTWGPEIATTLFLAPHIYLFIFLIGLPGQILFGVTTMTMSAVIVTYLWGLAYFALTGTYFFIDSYVPIAVFLGMHLLFTDPSTSPRTELGRVMFGVLYGLGVVALYAVLTRAGAPTFYDKLMAVPILNVLIKAIDTAARSPRLSWLDPARLGRSLRGRRRHLAFVAIWALVFGVMSRVEAVGDAHPGHRLPFWFRACDEGRPGACGTLARIEQQYCAEGAAWSCNELGLLLATEPASAPSAADAFRRACAAGVESGCLNASTLGGGDRPSARGAPSPGDYFVMLREGKGALPDRTPLELYGRACRQGWTDGCQKACSFGDVAACTVVRR